MAMNDKEVNALTREALMRAGFDVRALRKSTDFGAAVDIVRRLIAARGDTQDVMHPDDGKQRRHLIKALAASLETMHLEKKLWED